MRILLLTIQIVIYSINSFSQEKVDSIKVIFLHGSKPEKNHKNEYKTVGGLRGGHVVTQIDSNVYGFNYKSKRIRVFPHPFNKKSAMDKESANEFVQLKKGAKITIVTIPVSSDEYKRIKNFYESNANKADFDYAFFGMRCASTCYKGLSLCNVYKKSSNLKSIRKAFHPKQLRKRLCKTAQQKGYKVEVMKGRAGRIWEGDN
ncbi:MAG: hypothetical protein IPG89_14090 [Bacteroidetes bacterium]|nr:hypothetical protein [Bacteroidota bacterium]